MVEKKAVLLEKRVAQEANLKADIAVKVAAQEVTMAEKKRALAVEE